MCFSIMTMNSQKIIHCDADCFFAALEIRDDPRLRGIPVAVGGDPTRRGVISTCNYEARVFGVHSALASAQAKRLCPELIILPHNMEKYRHAAAQLRQIFLSYTDIIEPVSMDEAYLDVTDSDFFRGSATLIAQDIQRQVFKQVGITVSAGVAPNKFIAKVASDWKKPNGLTVVHPDDVDQFLTTLPVQKVPGVGKATANKLLKQGLKTCGDVRKIPQWQLCQWFGKFGLRLFAFSRGNDNRRVKSREFRKSLSVEHTMQEDRPPDACYEELSSLVKKLSYRLSALESGSVIKVFVKIKFADFTRTTIETIADTLSEPLCRALFDKAYPRKQQPIRLLGVGVRFKEAVGDMQAQLDLFSSNDDETKHQF